MRGKYNVYKKLKVAGINNCRISEITYAELLYGAECCDRPEETHRLVSDFCKDIGIVPIGESLREYAKQKASLRKKGTPIDDFDLLIACSALVNGYIIVTDNQRHFDRIPGLTIENWVDRRQ